MTEQEWLTSTKLDEKLAFAEGRASTRQLLLFSCACCRRIWDKLDSSLCHPLVEAAERFADDSKHTAELTELGREARELTASSNHAVWAASLLREARSWSTQNTSVITHRIRTSVGTACLPHQKLDLASKEMEKQEAILWDILGNPFRPASLDPRWLTSSVLDLAHVIYAERNFEQMPILGDALMDAGCADEEIISHCCREAHHVRGCWVIDLVLGKR